MKRSTPTVLFALGAFIVTLTIYVLRLNPVAGQMVDDAWYLVLAKSLAEGSGFRLISSATTAIQPLYPPGFPAILSLVFRAYPQFPQNVWLLKCVSVAAMLAAGALSYIYFHRHRQLSRALAGGAAMALMLTPSFVFLATSTVMSECVFTAFQLAAVVALHRAVEAQDERSGDGFVAGAAVLAAGTMLIRSIGITLIVAAAIWLVKERLWRRATVFCIVAVVCVVPWVLYARAHAPTAAQRSAHGGAVAYDYFDQLSMRWAGAPMFGRISGGELPERIRINFRDIFGAGMGGILVPVAFRSAGESGKEVIALIPKSGSSVPGMGGIRETLIISALLSAMALLGFVRAFRERITVTEVLMLLTLAVILAWPFWSYRFVLPMAPFLILYFTKGVELIGSRAARIVLFSLVGLHVYDHAGYLVHAQWRGRVEWVEQTREVDALLEWIGAGGLPTDEVLATTNPGLVYLRTGRRAIATDHPMMEWGGWKERGVRYVAVLYPQDLPPQTDGPYKILYHSAGRLWVVQI